jgi:hypothetical protein
LARWLATPKIPKVKSVFRQDTMNYPEWREQLFNHPLGSDPASLVHVDAFYDLLPGQTFDFVDHVLVDPEVHHIFSRDQLGIGINTIFSNCCSNLPFLYTTACDEDRRVQGISNLSNLYKNYFDRYCTGTVTEIGNTEIDDRMGFICYMFWDIFVLYPGNASLPMQAAAIQVMQTVLTTSNEYCLVSAIHGLGHWTFDVPAAVMALNTWLQKPTTNNAVILNYANIATTGRIL